MSKLDPKIYKIFQKGLEQFIQYQFDLDLYKIEIKDCLNDGYILCTITPETDSIFDLEHLPIPEHQWLCFPLLIEYLNAVQRLSEIAIHQATEKSLADQIIYQDSIPFLLSVDDLFQELKTLLALKPTSVESFFDYYEKNLLSPIGVNEVVNQDTYLEFKTRLCKLTEFNRLNADEQHTIQFPNNQKDLWESFVDYTDMQDFCEIQIVNQDQHFNIQIQSVSKPILFSQYFNLNVSKTVELLIRKYSLLSKNNIIGRPQPAFLEFFTNGDLDAFVSKQHKTKNDVIFPTLIMQTLDVTRNLGLDFEC